MLATSRDAMRADIDRQLGWARGEIGRQLRYTALTGALEAVAVLAALGAVVVGVIALYRWLATQTDPFIALGMIGGGHWLSSVDVPGVPCDRGSRSPSPQLCSRCSVKAVRAG